MVASYPGTVRVFTKKTDITDTVYADHPNSLQDEVLALESTIGLNPHLSTSPSAGGAFNSVSTLFASIADRLANIETGIVADTHNQYLRKAGGDQILSGTTSTVGLRLRGASGQTADLLQFLSGAGATIAAMGADGSLTVNNLTVNGTQTNVAGSATALDLGATTGIATGTGANYGDKIQLYTSTYGFGVQANRLVAYLPPNAGFAIRQNAGSGYASSGADAVVLGSDGSVLATGRATLNGALDLSASGTTLAGAGTSLGDKTSFYANTGLGMTDATHLSLFVPSTSGVVQIAPANSGAGAKSSGLVPGVQFTGGGVGNFKSDVRLNNVPMPRGQLDYGTRNNDGPMISSETMMSEHTCSFTALAGHVYRVTFTLGHAGAANNQPVFFRLRDGTSVASTQLQSAVVMSFIADGFGGTTTTIVWVLLGLSAGTHNITPSIAPYGSGSVRAKASANSINIMLVEDVGGSVQASL